MNHPEYDNMYIDRFYALTAMAWVPGHKSELDYTTLFGLYNIVAPHRKARNLVHPFKKLHTTQYADETMTKPHGVHLTSYNDCLILYYFKLLFQTMTIVDLNKKI